MIALGRRVLTGHRKAEMPFQPVPFLWGRGMPQPPPRSDLKPKVNSEPNNEDTGLKPGVDGGGLLRAFRRGNWTLPVFSHDS